MRTIQAVNPRTGREQGGFPALDGADVALVAASLRRSAARWAATPLPARIDVLRRWAVDAASDESVLEALVEDTGRTHVSRLELAAVPTLAERWAEWAEEGIGVDPTRTSSISDITIDQQRVPFAQVGFITPWNSPLGLSFIDAIPALVAGCTAIVKPSEVTPRFAGPLTRSIERHPELAAVLALVPGDGATGSAVIDVVDAVCFTGSVETGRKVARQCAGRLIPAFLELGGKDPAIVLHGADLDRAAAGIVWSGTMNTGQTCHSVERVYVDRRDAESFVAKLAAAAERVTLARPGPDDGC